MQNDYNPIANSKTSFQVESDTISGDTTKEQLYFSKQPREVYFKPHGLTDYRRLKEEMTNLKMGNLGPDLQSSEYLAKKEQKDKMKQYSKNVRTFHNTKGLPAGPGKMKEDSSNTVVAEKRAAAEKREKVKVYASQIPKPRTKVNDTTEKDVAPEVDSDLDFDSDADSDSDSSVLRAMERRHQLAKDNVSQIRKEFGLT